MSGAIKINGTSSGSTTITAPASGGDESIELSTALAAKLDASSGQVLRAFSTAKTDTFTTSSTSLVDVTGLSVSITPSSASNKVLVIVNLSFAANPSSTALHGAILRDSTQIALGDAAGSRARRTWIRSLSHASNAGAGTLSMTFLDSPASATAVTYKVQVLSDQGTAVYLNRTDGDSDVSYQTRAISTITVMEVAA